jgi:oxazoline/thiazoline synthase
MLTKPRFKAHGYLKTVEPDTLFFITADGSHEFQSTLYYALAALIDGQRTISELAALLKQDFKPVDILAALNNLQKQGLIEEATNSNALPAEQINALHGLHLDPRKLTQAQVTVRCFGRVDPAAFVALLESMCVAVVPTDAPDLAFDVILTDDYLQPALDEFNRRTTRPWLLVRPLGAPLLIGPLFQPGKTACYECLRNRLQFQRQIESLYARETQDFPPYPVTSHPAASQIAFGMAALEVTRWFAEPENSPLINAVRSIHPLTAEVQNHVLSKRPQCPVCGDPAPREVRPIELCASPKVIGNDGGFRTATPAETIAKYEHHISPITGIAPYLRLLSNKSIAYTYITGMSITKEAVTWEIAKNLGRNSASGKGVTEIQAKVSGLCEAIERYSGIYEGNESRLEARYADLGDQAIHPSTLLHFSEKQYAHRIERNQTAHGSKQFIPMPFDETHQSDWTPVWSLTTGARKYVPTAFCYYGYSLPADHRFCIADSNGNAAGSSMEDAIFQGFLELVERDAVALWWYNQIRRPGVDLAGIDDTYFAQLRDYYRSIQREFWVLDLTSDLGIPVFGAISRRIEGQYELPFTGLGAHLDPRIALMRAISEMNQLLHPHQTEPLAENKDSMMSSSTADLTCLLPDPRVPLQQFADYRYLPTDDLRDDLNACLNVLSTLGLEMLVLDQTRPDIGLPVVKVIVPGLRHFWPRFGAGRLYDVPIKLGWLSHPLNEDELNPLVISG